MKKGNRGETPIDHKIFKSYLALTKAVATTVVALSLVASAVTFASAKSGANTEKPIWPLPDRTDLSSGYGDFRPGRFHFGLDLRTGDKRLPVVAPVSGSIKRIRVAYTGYGKALYLSGDDGQTYVFAHLDHFARRFDTLIRNLQLEQTSYRVDRWFQPGVLTVKQGDTVAFSGKTGIGAPHLHFEIRDRDNVPRSPLLRGLTIPDNRGPKALSLTFEYLDDGSLFPDGRRRRTMKAIFDGQDADGAMRYSLSSAPYLSAEFGLIFRCRDYPTNKQFSSSPLMLSLEVSDRLVESDSLEIMAGDFRLLYQVKLDSLSYSEGSLSSCVYEQGMAREGSKDAYLLFSRSEGAGCYGDREWDWTGRLPEPGKENAYGVYPARIVAEDVSGNRSILDFSFCWGPPGELYNLTDFGPDFALLTPDDSRLLRKKLYLRKIRIAKLREDGGWEYTKKIQIKRYKDGAVRLSATGLFGGRRRNIYRVVPTGLDGWRKPDLIFSDQRASEKIKIELDYQLRAGGLFVTATTNSPTTTIPQMQITGESGAKTELVEIQTGANTFVAFLPAADVSEALTDIAVYRHESDMEPADTLSGLRLETVDSLATEAGSQARWAPVSGGVALGPLEGLEKGRIVELSRWEKKTPLKSSILVGPIALAPEDFRYDYKVKIGMRLYSANMEMIEEADSQRVALCRLRDKGDKWSWMDTESSGDSNNVSYYADIQTNGVYALMIDRLPPTISKIRPHNGSLVSGDRPLISATIKDDLSGLKNSALFDVRLDGRWLIPEYDAEDEEFAVRPHWRLAPGEHELVFNVSDVAGNRTQRSVKFRVQAKKK